MAVTDPIRPWGARVRVEGNPPRAQIIEWPCCRCPLKRTCFLSHRFGGSHIRYVVGGEPFWVWVW